MSFATENNSLCGYGWSKYDGDVGSVFAKMGELKKVVLTPIKHVFISDAKVCREKPYNDIMVGIQFSSPVDFNTMPVDCQNFLALTAAMLSCVCRGTKTMRANFSDH